jgi:hypothetical protein
MVECGCLPGPGWGHGVWQSLADLSGFVATWVSRHPDRLDDRGRKRFSKSRQAEGHVGEGQTLHEALCQAGDVLSGCRLSGLRLGWNYAIRIASNTYITLPDGRSDRLDNWVPVNCNRYFQDVLLTLDTKLQTNVSVTWTTDEKGQPDMVPIITNQIACRARLREYAGRMGIEQSFRDDKSGGFDLAHTRLQHAQRLDHLLLALSIATLWCHELGEFVLEQGEPARCSVDPAHERTLSLFQLGLRWLKRFLTTGLLFLPDFQASLSNLKLKPVFIPVKPNPRV